MRIPRLSSLPVLAALLIGAVAAGSPPSAAAETTSPPRDQSAVFAGGCFWGVQAVFQHVKGVREVTSGYSGGDAIHAHYADVSEGNSGHAESVRIVFDPAMVSYGQLLQIFFSVAHDPTQVNRQGPDVGPQYRSAIFYGDEAQRRMAEDYVSQLNRAGTFPRPIVTQIRPLKNFFPAEPYHQDYVARHPDNPYVAFNDLPKLTALKTTYPSLYRSEGPAASR